jgi:hypothetical protein
MNVEPSYYDVEQALGDLLPHYGMPHASIGIPRWNGPNLTDKDNCFIRLQKGIMDTTHQCFLFSSFPPQIFDVAKVATIHTLI